MRLEAAAGAHAQQPLDPDLDQLLDDDRGRRTPHPRGLYRDRLAFPRARVSEHPALGIPLDGVVEIGLRDVLRAQRIPWEQARLAVVAFACPDVDRHDAEPYRDDRAGWARGVAGRAGSATDPRVLRRGSRRASVPGGHRAAWARAVQRGG